MKSVAIKNIKVEEINFSQKLSKLNKHENKALKNALSYIKFLNPGIDGKLLLPKRSKYRVDFDIHNTCSGFANGIRRCIMEEIPIISMWVGCEVIETNDRYILSDNLQKNIGLIPVVQDVNFGDTSNWKMSIDILNSTDEVIYVKSGDIEIFDGENIIPTKNFMSPNISLVELHPTKFLKIEKIQLIEGLSVLDRGKFATVSNTRYKILDATPMAHNADEQKNPGTSSLIQNSTQFHIGYTTYRNTRFPKAIVLKCCDSLHGRLVAFSEELNNVKENMKTHIINHFSMILDVETRGELKLFSFKGEFWTLINMISQYCFLLDRNIPFVAPSIIHPSTEIGVIKIKHNNSVKIIQDAINAILKDIAILRKSFE